MNKRLFLKILALLMGLGILSWLMFGFFGIQALFYDKAVNETVPDIVMEKDPAPKTSTTSLPISPTSTAPKILARGTFGQGDSTYTIAGKATVTEKNGVRTLSLTDFAVTNGPDLFVYMVSAPSAENKTVKEAAEAGSFVNLGALKGNRGNQTYTIPSNLVLDENSVISIWCRRFSRNFGAADLSTP